MSKKLGVAYQELVAELMTKFDDGTATIEEGVWINHEYGRRDTDVSIRGKIEGKDFFIFVECKDYTKAGAGKVGIELIDSLESKSRDLNADAIIICSNSGFTDPALRKCRGVGIHALSALKKADDRVKIKICKEIYFPIISVGELNFTYNNNKRVTFPEGILAYSVTCGGKPIDSWLLKRVPLIMLSNTRISGKSITYKANFLKTAKCQFKNKTIELDSIQITFTPEVKWYAQTVTLDANAGFFDHLSGKIKLAPGDNQYHIEGLNFDKGVEITEKESAFINFDELRKHEVDAHFALFKGFNVLHLEEDYSEFEKLINPADLVYKMNS